MEDKQQLRQLALQTLAYEWQMLSSLRESASSDLNRRNAYLESFLLHARNLIEFFYHDLLVKRPSKDDIRVDDCGIDGNQWKSTRPSLTEFLRTQRVAMNKYLAHVTWTRSISKQSWNRPMIYGELARVMDTFKHLLQSTK